MIPRALLFFPPQRLASMVKHTRSLSSTSISPPKRPRIQNGFLPNRVAAPDAAAAVDADPPLPKLLRAVEDGVKEPAKGDSVIYWMRMGDLRSAPYRSTPVPLLMLCVPVSDNRALSLASAQAQRDHVPLVVIFIVVPQDYVAHDRSARRIDFTLRNLKLLKVYIYTSPSVAPR